ncbi:hypothetical protein ORR04_02790 [Levilactobacillus brevis]|uniref:Uncharacterized protein n=1 Tax=Levilactobacillus brevis TaxID=1580 RepID=A0AB38X7X4_LEVBR|nr:hypothetical protein [Levilactobacillus brevis]WAD02143.1 hypothetical protein ORR04_02790 [Levilactobacillus brevis]
MKNEIDGATGCLLFIALLAVTVAAFFLKGLYLMLAWSWVMVPIFKLPALTYWGATAISFLWVILFGPHPKLKDNGDPIDSLKSSVLILATDALFMGILWLVILGI